jgi:hypothetical protein
VQRDARVVGLDAQQWHHGNAHASTNHCGGGDVVVGAKHVGRLQPVRAQPGFVHHLTRIVVLADHRLTADVGERHRPRGELVGTGHQHERIVEQVT